MFSTSGALNEWIVTDAVPSAAVIAEVALKVTPGVWSVPNVTVASGTGAPVESVTVAFAVEIAAPPSARIDGGVSVSDTEAGTPGVPNAWPTGMTSATRRPARASPKKRRDRTRELPLDSLELPTVPPSATWCFPPEGSALPQLHNGRAGG